jgi:hypothetical protein
MSSFTDPLELSPDHGEWRLTRQLDYEVGKVGSGLMISIPAGFVTDLATVPRVFWSLFPPDDPQYSAACVLHDYLCTYHGFNQRVADAFFLEALQLLGVPWWKRIAMYYAVRSYMTIFGDATQRA